MGKIIAEMAATIAVVPLCATYLPGIHCANVEFGVVTGLALAILYLLLRPIARALTGLIGCLTLSLIHIFSMGAMGAMYVSEARTLYAPALRVEARSTVGAGDAMVGGMLLGLQKSGDMAQAFRCLLYTSRCV